MTIGWSSGLSRHIIGFIGVISLPVNARIMLMLVRVDLGFNPGVILMVCIVGAHAGRSSAYLEHATGIPHVVIAHASKAPGLDGMSRTSSNEGFPAPVGSTTKDSDSPAEINLCTQTLCRRIHDTVAKVGGATIGFAPMAVFIL